MELFYIDNLNKIPSLEANTCVIGTFDGLHIGHQSLIKKAKSYGFKTLLITFENQRKTNYHLMSTKQKHNLMDKYGVDYLIVFPYLLIKDLKYFEFIDILKKLNVKNMICGADFRFGYNREGGIEELLKHFNISVLAYEELEENRASSSIIKEMIDKGDLHKASKYLGRDYSIICFVKGFFNNDNVLELDYQMYLLPPNGLYHVKVITNTKVCYCKLEITNIELHDKRMYLYFNQRFDISKSSEIEIVFTTEL